LQGTYSDKKSFKLPDLGLEVDIFSLFDIFFDKQVKFKRVRMTKTKPVDT